MSTDLELLHKLRGELDQAQQTILMLKNKIDIQKKTLNKQQKVIDQTNKKIKSIFNEDQLKVLGCRSTKERQWSTETIQKGLRTRLVCEWL